METQQKQSVPKHLLKEEKLMNQALQEEKAKYNTSDNSQTNTTKLPKRKTELAL